MGRRPDEGVNHDPDRSRGLRHIERCTYVSSSCRAGLVEWPSRRTTPTRRARRERHHGGEPVARSRAGRGRRRCACTDGAHLEASSRRRADCPVFCEKPLGPICPEPRVASAAPRTGRACTAWSPVFERAADIAVARSGDRGDGAPDDQYFRSRVLRIDVEKDVAARAADPSSTPSTTSTCCTGCSATRPVPRRHRIRAPGIEDTAAVTFVRRRRSPSSRAWHQVMTESGRYSVSASRAAWTDDYLLATCRRGGTPHHGPALSGPGCDGAPGVYPLDRALRLGRCVPRRSGLGHGALHLSPRRRCAHCLVDRAYARPRLAGGPCRWTSDPLAGAGRALLAYGRCARMTSIARGPLRT